MKITVDNGRRDKTKEAYQFEVSCVGRMRTEIIHLRALVNSQQELINQLVSENKNLRQDKYALRKKMLLQCLLSQLSPV